MEMIVREIPTEKITLGHAQVRTIDEQKGIHDLANSMRIIGLLEPIVVCPGEREGEWEVLAGQRRTLAARELISEGVPGWTTIPAVIRARPDDPTEAKVISLTENLVRLDLNRKNAMDAVNELFFKYGDISAIVDTTGLPAQKVKDLIKGDRLNPELQSLYRSHDVDLKSLLRAQDAATDPITGKTDVADSLKYANEFKHMSGPQQTKLVKEVEKGTPKSADELIENAKGPGRVTQFTVTLGASVHQGLRQYASVEGTNLDDAAATLISESLDDKGYLEPN